MCTLQNHQAAMRSMNCTLNSSSLASAFVSKYYKQVKRLNPRLPVLVRPVEDEIEPQIIARYGVFA